MNIQRFEFVYTNDFGNEYPAYERLEIDGEYVKYEDHHVQLAALREDKKTIASLQNEVTVYRNEAEGGRTLLGQALFQAANLSQRLTAAEQRNAETSAALQLSSVLLEQTLAALNPTAKLSRGIREFLKSQRTKPTESGATHE